MTVNFSTSKSFPGAYVMSPKLSILGLALALESVAARNPDGPAGAPPSLSNRPDQRQRKPKT